MEAREHPLAPNDRGPLEIAKHASPESELARENAETEHADLACVSEAALVVRHRAFRHQVPSYDAFTISDSVFVPL